MDAVLFGLSLGLFAGLSPGPLMAVVIAAALERGTRAGVLTALAPLLTDAPVILLSLVVLRRVPPWFLAAVSVAGGLFVAYLGIITIRDAGRPMPPPAAPVASSRDVWRGALVNLLSPHPWIFWFTIGTPFLIRSWGEGRWRALAFLAIFLGLLVGCKAAVAWAAARGRRFLDAGWYRLVMRGCGVLLVGFGLSLIWRIL